MTADVFASAAHAFARLVRELPAESFDGPGLGEWDLRALVGHTSRSLVTVTGYLKNRAATADLAGPVEYYVAIRGLLSDARGVAERGRQAGRDLGGDPAGTVDHLVEQALSDIDGVGDPLITVIGGLGSAVSELLAEKLPTPVKKVGVEDVFGMSGPALELLDIFGLNADNIVRKAKEAIAMKK